ncbi:MAG: hypothetical protein ABIN89_10905 [Chitinophagaceae bacterium]
MFKKDNFKLGVLLGFTAPILGLIIYYYINFFPRHVKFMEFLGYLKEYRSFLTAVSSISLLANAVLFTIYVNGHRDKTAKGIFLATVIYGITVLLIKVIK